MRPPLIVAGRALTRELQNGPSWPALTISADRQFDMLVDRRAG
jgi:hypothetical protein